MTEKTGSEYLKAAAEHMRKIYLQLGHSPNATKYDKIADIQFKHRRLKKNGVKFNQLKEAAGVPKRTPGTKTGEPTHSCRSYIFCKACNSKIADKECVPDYKEEFCNTCPNKQPDNIKKTPDLPKELEMSDRYNDLFGNRFMNGDSIYLTDVGPI